MRKIALDCQVNPAFNPLTLNSTLTFLFSGAIATCVVRLPENLDTVTVVAEILPCDAQASINLKISESKFGVSYSTSIAEGSGLQHIAIPGMLYVYFVLVCRYILHAGARVGPEPAQQPLTAQGSACRSRGCQWAWGCTRMCWCRATPTPSSLPPAWTCVQRSRLLARSVAIRSPASCPSGCSTAPTRSPPSARPCPAAATPSPPQASARWSLCRPTHIHLDYNYLKQAMQ